MVKISRAFGAVILNEKGEIILVNQHGTSWSLPKGHMKKGENYLDTLKREIYEELEMLDKLLKEGKSEVWQKKK